MRKTSEWHHAMSAPRSAYDKKQGMNKTKATNDEREISGKINWRVRGVGAMGLGRDGFVERKNH